jgi:hypothetical protein
VAGQYSANTFVVKSPPIANLKNISSRAARQP